MTYEDLIRRLRDRSALIVHFSHHANMRAGGVFPADLHAAALNSRLWPLSCCLVWPAHSMSLPGSVGLVLRPRSLASIVGVSSSDAGYATDRDGSELGAGQPLDDDTFKRSFQVPDGGYNEWRVRESEVVGIYVEGEGGKIYVKKQKLLNDPDTGLPLSQEVCFQSIPLTEVHDAFPDLPVYSRCGGEIIATKIPGSVLYPWHLTGACD